MPRPIDQTLVATTLSEEERHLVEEAATDEGMKLPDFIRARALALARAILANPKTEVPIQSKPNRAAYSLNILREHKDLLVKAAKLKGLTISEFLAQSSVGEAHTVIERKSSRKIAI